MEEQREFSVVTGLSVYPSRLAVDSTMFTYTVSLDLSKDSARIENIIPKVEGIWFSISVNNGSTIIMLTRNIFLFRDARLFLKYAKEMHEYLGVLCINA